jgi:hypothetical protein
MKKRTFMMLGIMTAIGIFILVTIINAQPRAVPEESTNGRYMLMQGKYLANTIAERYENQSIFKIDTQTGKVWLYREEQYQDKAIISKWILISE